MKWNEIEQEIKTIRNRLDQLRHLMIDAELLSRWFRSGDVELDLDMTWRFIGYDDDFTYCVPDELIDMPESEYPAWIEVEKERKAELKRKEEERERQALAQREQKEKDERYQRYLSLKGEFEAQQPAPAGGGKEAG